MLDLNKKIKNTPLAFSVIFIAIYALCKIFYPQDNIPSLFFFITGILVGLLYIVNMYYVNSYIFFKGHEEKVNIPMKKIQSTNTFYIGGFLILCLVIMILFTWIPLGGIGSFLSHILVMFIKFLLSTAMLILKKPEEIILEEEVSEYALGSGKSNIDELTIQNKKEELTAIYEKARYSNRECSKEEVKLVKDILK